MKLLKCWINCCLLFPYDSISSWECGPTACACTTLWSSPSTGWRWRWAVIGGHTVTWPDGDSDWCRWRRGWAAATPSWWPAASARRGCPRTATCPWSSGHTWRGTGTPSSVRNDIGKEKFTISSCGQCRLSQKRFCFVILPTLYNDVLCHYIHTSDNLQRRQSSRSSVKVQETAYQLLRQYAISRTDSEQLVSLKIVESYPQLF